MQSNKKHSFTNAIVGIWTVLLTTFVVGSLYFAKEVLIPLALAALLTFLLTPLVSRIERVIGRIAAVLLVTVMIFLCASMVTWVFSRQLVDLAGKLPDYKENLHAKIHAFQLPGGGLTRFSQTIEELKNDLVGEKASKPVPTAQPVSAHPPAAPDIFHSSPLTVAQMVMASLLGPIGTAGLVTLLVIFMLFKREDLRRRFIRMIGLGRINMTTRAMDDAGARVARYLSRLLMVNVSFGIIIVIGLFLIGIPNAILWGCLAAILRFIPYIGCWIAAILPVSLSLAVSTSWAVPLMVLGLFVGLELFNSNVLEPWLYGASTGVSSFALIVAAVFWTWLWGPVGLLLSTPLTVCLVVMGRHVPRLAFLSVMLSDEHSLTPAEDCYHRLLSVGLNEAVELVDAYLKTNSLTSLYDTVLIPVVAAAEIDLRRDNLDTEQHDLIEQGIRDMIDDICTRPVAPGEAVILSEASHIFCLPARALRDDLAGSMLAQLLQEKGYNASVSSLEHRDLTQTLEMLKKANMDILCITVVPPSTVIHARYLCIKIKEYFPKLPIVVTLWGSTLNLQEASERLYTAGATKIAITLEGTLAAVREITEQPVDSEKSNQ